MADKSYDILAVSDIALGYGSPQILSFLQSMAAYYNTQAYVIETDEPHRPPQDLSHRYDRLDIKRVLSALPYWTMGAHCERNHMAVNIANEYKSSTIILFSPMQLPFVKKLSYKPERVILYLLEIDAEQYGRALHQYSHLATHIIAPEYERLKHILTNYCTRPYPKSSVVYNVTDRPVGSAIIPASSRNGRVVYAGTLSAELTLAHEYLSDDFSVLPIDIYGNFSGIDKESLEAKIKLYQSGKGLNYNGYVASAWLQSVLPHYAFSITRWNPSAGLNYLWACPNKFFEALAFGIPVISSPHPQAVDIINRYKCGILAEGFGAEHMIKAARQALALYKTPEYADMVARALHAYEAQFNWDTQFNNFATALNKKAE